MTTNQTIDRVPREVLSDAFEELPDWNTPTATKLRALLDAPAKPEPSCIGDLERFESDGEDFVKVGDVIDMLGNMKAAQPQGEQVVLPKLKDGNGPTLSNHRSYNQGWNAYAEAVRKLGPLYAKQPAPVAAVQTCCGSCPGGCVIQAATK